MKTSHFAHTRQVQRQLLLSLATASLFLAGCSTTSSTGSVSSPITQAVTLSGQVHGGNQPVSGATVQLYLAGQGPGLPSAATLLATTTSSNNGSGSFSFTRNPIDGAPLTPTTNLFSCPSIPPGSPLSQNGGRYVFVVARGGNTVNDGSTTVNNDAVFLAPFGRCGGITTNTVVNMSEVVTAATVAAVHQYMDPSVSPIESSIGSDGIYISDLALSRSFDNVSNMVDLSTGLARATRQRTSGVASVTGVTVTVTPEQAKINHIANILSSCINNATSGSSACSTLYSFTAPPADFSTTSVPAATAGTATDVLTAAYYLFTNPTNGSPANLAGLYNIPSPTAPYQPMLTTQPTDWTIGIDYTATGNCADVAGSTANFLNRAVDLAVDINSNLWFSNNQSAAGSLGGMDPTGVPVACFTLPAGTSNQGGGLNSGAESTVVDVQGNIWVGSARSNDIYRLTPNGSGTATIITATTAAPVVALTADGYGDVFYATNAGNLYELANAATASALPAAVLINTLPLGAPAKIMIDTNNTIWAAASNGSITGTTGTATSTTPASLSNFTTTSFSVGGTSYGISATRSYGSNETGGPGVYVSDVSGSTVTYLLTSGGISGTPFTGGGISRPAGISVDGSQNVWVANTTGTGPSQFTRTGTALSPSTGYSKTALPVSQRSIVIDASGNVWLGREGANTITEIVGAAVPVVQPYATGLPPATASRFQRIP